MVAPRALVFRPLVKGDEDYGNEIVCSVASQSCAMQVHSKSLSLLDPFVQKCCYLITCHVSIKIITLNMITSGFVSQSVWLCQFQVCPCPPPPPLWNRGSISWAFGGLLVPPMDHLIAKGCLARGVAFHNLVKYGVHYFWKCLKNFNTFYTMPYHKVVFMNNSHNQTLTSYLPNRRCFFHAVHVLALTGAW